MIHSSFPKLEPRASGEKRCYKLPDAVPIPTFVVKELVLEGNHYTLEPEDTNDYLVFNSNNNIILHIPDNLPKGYGSIATNIGNGTIEVVMDGLETLRGWHTLTDFDSFITVIKITDTLWQSSERR